jgi:hypothetical protein
LPAYFQNINLSVLFSAWWSMMIEDSFIHSFIPPSLFCLRRSTFFLYSKTPQLEKGGKLERKGEKGSESRKSVHFLQGTFSPNKRESLYFQLYLSFSPFLSLSLSFSPPPQFLFTWGVLQ